jgi:hypothetical protein
MSDDYFALKGAHYSGLKHLGRSALHYAQAEEEPGKSTEAQLVGTATHWAVFEPQKFTACIAVWDRRNGKRSGHKWTAFEASALLNRQIILTEAEQEVVLRLASAVRNSPQVKPFFEHGGESEKEITWIDAETGIACKAKLDWVCRLGIVDLKTTKDASPDGFGRECARYSYHQQGGLYTDGWSASHDGEALPYFIIAAEKTPPHVVQVYRVDGDVLELGRAEMHEYLRRLAKLQKLPRDQWPGYADGVLDLALPRWAMPSEEGLNGMNLDMSEVDVEEEGDET